MCIFLPKVFTSKYFPFWPSVCLRHSSTLNDLIYSSIKRLGNDLANKYNFYTGGTRLQTRFCNKNTPGKRILYLILIVWLSALSMTSVRLSDLGKLIGPWYVHLTLVHSFDKSTYIQPRRRSAWMRVRCAREGWLRSRAPGWITRARFSRTPATQTNLGIF